MKGHRSKSLLQLAISLQLEQVRLSPPQLHDALVRALADLLLEAMQEPGYPAQTAQGGADEPEDHV